MATLDTTARHLSASGPSLADVAADFAGMVQRQHLATADPLGLGSLLTDADRVAQPPGDPDGHGARPIGVAGETQARGADGGLKRLRTKLVPSAGFHPGYELPLRRLPGVEAFLRGTLAPARRASDNPLAIACLRLVTLRPDRPPRSVPFLRSVIARFTFFPAFLAYFRATTHLRVQISRALYAAQFNGHFP